MARFRPFLKPGDAYSLTAKSSVDALLKLLGFEADLLAVFDAWDKETRQLIRHCEAVAIQGTKLVIRVPSAVHRQELFYSKEKLLKRLNQAMGRAAITDLVFELDQTKGGFRGKEPTRPSVGDRG